MGSGISSGVSFTAYPNTLPVVFLAVRRFCVDSLCDVGRLLVHRDDDRAASGVKAQFRVVISDAFDRLAGNRLVVEFRLGRNFAGDDDETRVHERFACDTTFLVRGEGGIEDGVRNLVGDLVRVTFGNGFRSKEIVGHGFPLF